MRKNKMKFILPYTEEYKVMRDMNYKERREELLFNITSYLAWNIFIELYFFTCVETGKIFQGIGKRGNKFVVI